MSKYIVWFRQDLRLDDNPALYYAAKKGQVIPVFIYDDINTQSHTMGQASQYWLKNLLKHFQKACLDRLRIFHGDPIEILPKLVHSHQVEGLFWNRCYEPWRIHRDRHLKSILKCEVQSFNGSLLWEPWQILKSDGTPYRVFTPFYRKGCLVSEHQPREPLASVDPDIFMPIQADESHPPVEIIPEKKWGETLLSHWNTTQNGPQSRLKQFIQSGLCGYKKERDFPSHGHTSQLSVDLHWGTLSPNQVRQSVMAHPVENPKDLDHFLSELGWREFSYYLLYHFPFLPKDNLQKKFDHFPWIDDKKVLKSWQFGQTGYPIVDAGMRQMYATGYMHNRLRMIVGSFLVKNLLQHWHHGQAWFWECLVDADLASNSASWQWIAGSGADAAPYFRIFNPITQGEKFDPLGEYTKKWVPELQSLPSQYLFKPWEAPHDVLKKANIILGQDYPKPIVDVRASRERALAAFQSLKEA